MKYLETSSYVFVIPLQFNVTVHCGSQDDILFLQSVIDNTTEPFDIVIDDGGHTMHQQMTSIRTLLQAVNRNGRGLYVIEDLETSYKSGYDTNPTGPVNYTTVEVIKRLVDDVQKEKKNKWYPELASHIYSFEIGPNIVFFRVK